MLEQVGSFPAVDGSGHEQTLYRYRHVPGPGPGRPSPEAARGAEEVRTASGHLAEPTGSGRFRVAETGAVLAPAGRAPAPAP